MSNIHTLCMYICIRFIYSISRKVYVYVLVCVYLYLSTYTWVTSLSLSLSLSIMSPVPYLFRNFQLKQIPVIDKKKLKLKKHLFPFQDAYVVYFKYS